MSFPASAPEEVRSHLHAIVGLAERIVSEVDHTLAQELATAICHQSRFLLDGSGRAGDTSTANAPSAGALSSHTPSAETPSADAPSGGLVDIDTSPPEELPASGAVVVDPSVLQTLADEIGSPEIVGSLVETFLGELEERVKAIQAGITSSADEACRAAHTLKGTAATMGAMELAEISGQIEHIFRSDTADGAEPEALAAQLDGAGERCRTGLQQIVQDMEVAT